MKNKFFPILLGLLLMVFAAPAVHAALVPPVGLAIEPHGFPAFYQDGTGLQLEPCLPPPAGNAVLRPDLCVFGPLAGPPLQVGDEIFWWMADAQLPPLVPGGKAILVLGLEGAFTTGSPVDGQQIVFSRLRIRVDVPTVGLYTITHPFGQEPFNVTDTLAGINHTIDWGSINVLAPDNAYVGALTSPNVGPFLTWPNYLNDNTLKGFNENGVVVEQYIGNPAIPHVVTGSPSGNNLFRIQGPGGIDLQTNLFTVVGKVYDPTVPQVAHVFPAPPTPNLFAVGPVNREGAVGAATPLQPEGIRTGVDYTAQPVGFPLWYQDNAVTSTPAKPVGGIKLGYCPGADPMCISLPVDPANPNSVALRAGGEGFWWSADAGITGSAGFADARLVLAVEAFFNNNTIVDGNQVGFARRRIRIRGLTLAGNYTVTHPYGTEVFTAVSDRKGGFEIDNTVDTMIVNTNPADLAATDNAFTGALFGMIGPRFLTWTTFNDNVTLTDPALLKPVVPGDLSRMFQYVGDPATPHAVTGSPTGNNIFRIEGPGIPANTETPLFIVTGKLFDPALIGVGTTLPGVPAPVTEVITMTKARFDRRKLQIDLAGTSNSIGSTLVIHAGPDATGPVLGQVVVDPLGAWRLRGTTTVNLTSVTIISSTGGTLLNQPVQVR